MKLSLNWIGQFVDIDKRKAEELAQRVSVSLTEVEKIENFRGVDVVMEIENKALTHRPDCFSHIGIAREIACIERLNFKNPLEKLNKKKLTFPKKTLPLQVTLKEDNLCKRYTAVILKDIHINPSPLWLQERLLACGVKPINNVVDVTNFVMLELGQPLHAFDYEKIKEKGNTREIIVRLARRNERITTLDGIQRELKKDMIVIADLEKAIGIAGIMGGANTEISEDTKTIVIESANFNEYSIRRTGKITGLHTEATLRFEKGQDPNLTYPAIVYVIQLLEKYAKAKLVSSIIDIYPQKTKQKSVVINTQKITRRIGTEIKDTEIKKILKRLEFEIVEEKDDQLKLAVPSFRNDIEIEEDFVEEIARIYGYDKITPQLPTRAINPVTEDLERKNSNNILSILSFLGLHEIYSYSFVSEYLYRKAQLDHQKMLTIKNPISPELRYVRDSIIPSVLEKAEVNCRNFEEFGIFEIGKEIHSLSLKKLPEEKKKISGIYYSKNQNETFYKVKGIVETLLNHLDITNYQFVLQENPQPFLDPNKSAQIKLLIYNTTGNLYKSKVQMAKEKPTEIILGYLGNLNKEVRNNFSMNGCATVFDLDFESLLVNIPEKNRYHPLSRYPSLFEDLSFIVSGNLPVETLRQKIDEVDEQISNVTLKERPFYSVKFGNNKKSVTFTIEYRNSKKTLNNTETQYIRHKIIQTLKKEYQAQIRE